MKQNEIKYYVENGKSKVTMDQDTAREIKVAIDAFRAGVRNSTYTEDTQQLLVAEYVMNTFLQDNVSKSMARSHPGILTFLQAVEDKSDELLK